MCVSQCDVSYQNLPSGVLLTLFGQYLSQDHSFHPFLQLLGILIQQAP